MRVKKNKILESMGTYTVYELNSIVSETMDRLQKEHKQLVHINEIWFDEERQILAYEFFTCKLGFLEKIIFQYLDEKLVTIFEE